MLPAPLLAQTGPGAFRFSCLCAAVLLYGAYGSPTPDSPGWTEAFIGALLLLAVSPAAAFRAIKPDFSAPFWRGAGQCLLVFGLAVPVALGAWNGHAPRMILRDLVPFLFMLLPVFLAPDIAASPARRAWLLLCVLALGTLLAVRAAGGEGPVAFIAPLLGRSEKLHYLANMPGVLFAATFFAGTAMMLAVRRPAPGPLALALLFFFLSLTCLWPVAMTQQRAGIGVFALSLAPVLLLCLRDRPGRTLGLLLPCAALAAIFFRAEIGEVLDTLIRKSEIVGSNRRFAEAGAVWSEIRAHPVALLFGEGWGAQFASPAVAGITVNFTHGLFSSLLLKTGIAGLVLGLSYVGGILFALFRNFRAAPVFVVALAGPVLIDVFLYASFKSLDFGLVLLLAAAGSAPGDFYGDERG